MQTIDELKEKILPLLLPIGVKRVAIFGSVSRGEESEESDVDILVELKDPSERKPIGLRWFGIEQELRQLIGREVDLVTSNALSPYIRESVERDMVVIYDEG